MNSINDNQERLGNIFFPQYNRAKEDFDERNSRFAYYTSADTLLKILGTQEVWMRSTKVMNDYREVVHGLKILAKAFKSPEGKVLIDLLNESYDGLWGNVESYFQRGGALEYQVYATCMSEHLTREKEYGRLSMWRAYGRNVGVALILKAGPFFQPAHGIGAFTTPVTYLDDAEGVGYIREIALNVSREIEFIQQVGREAVINTLLAAFAFASVSMKHPAFEEEREWRVVTFDNFLENLDHQLIPTIETVSGIPQRVIKIPLRNFPAENIDLTPTSLIDEILIGPCAHPEVIAISIMKKLDDLGFEDSEDMVRITQIPLRA